jgi:hypothetical protein
MTVCRQSLPHIEKYGVRTSIGAGISLVLATWDEKSSTETED